MVTMNLFQVRWQGGGTRLFADRDEAECAAMDRLFSLMSLGKGSPSVVIRYPDGREMKLSAQKFTGA